MSLRRTNVLYKGQFLKPFLFVTSVNFVLKMAEAGSSQVTLAVGASFVNVNGKDWEVGQSIRARGTNVTKKKELMKIFGPLWSEGVVEEKFVSIGRKR